MIGFALRNLLHRKTRTAISVAAIAAQFAFVLLLIGLCVGTLEEVGERIENIGSDIIVLPPGGKVLLSMSSAVMPLEPVRAALEATEGVRVAAPIIIAETTEYGSYSMIFGIEPRSYALAGRNALELQDGKLIEGPDDLLVDRRLAHSEGLEVGEKVELLKREFTVCGIVKAGAGVRMYLHIATVQELHGRVGKASAFFVRARADEQVPAVLDALKRKPAFKGYKLISNDQYAKLLGSATFGVKEFITAVTFISVVFGFLIISLAMYTSIIERTRQIGVLKSLGANPSYIARAFLFEATMMAAIGIPTGFAIAVATKAILHHTFPTLIVLFTRDWIAYTAMVALLATVLGSLYPALRAARVDPVVALGYE